jgi:peroxiredoxin
MLALLVAGALLPMCGAGTYNDVLNLGDAAPAWRDLPGVDDRKHSLADLQAKEVVVLVFTCNSCPAAEDYEERINAFVTRNCVVSTSKVALVAINVNTVAEDRLPKMKERAQERGFKFPYLYDETQKIARLYGAMYTPEFFVFDRERKIVYMGAMDDRDNAALAKTNFVQQAVEAALRGQKPEVGETIGRGCRIRYNRVKN